MGAYQENNNSTGVNGDQASTIAPESGAAYVFTRVGGVWSQEAYLKASNSQPGDRFGVTVALSNETLVVGAELEDSCATGSNGNQANNSCLNAGAAYVFTRTGGIWSQEAYLKSSNPEAGGRFGWSVALAGDMLVVGAKFESSESSRSGVAYVFTRIGGIWSQQARLKASNPDLDDEFGSSVALSGGTLVVGATAEDSNATGVNGDQANNSASGSGAAYVFVVQ